MRLKWFSGMSPVALTAPAAERNKDPILAVLRRVLPETGLALVITAAYWFTASTSFANPAVTLARALSYTFAGIAPADVPAFVAAQVLGAGVALLTAERVFDWRKSPDEAATLAPAERRTSASAA
jgi:glycerol uptake facilitator-like aquaporin